LWEELRKRAEWYCGPTVPQDAELWELGWRGQGAVVTYLKCPRCGKGECYVEDDQGQGTLPYWKKEKISWCGCRCQRAKLCAGIKPTALCSAFDKENSIEFLLDFLLYLYTFLTLTLH